MKSDKIILVLSLFLGMATTANAQIFEKLMKKVFEKDVAADTVARSPREIKKKTKEGFMELMGEMENPQNFESSGANTFVGWPYDSGDIYLFTLDKQRLHSGYIFEDGNFLAMFPDGKVKANMPVADWFNKKCKAPEQAAISNPKAKLAFGLLYVYTRKGVMGGLVRANSMVKAKNVFNQGEDGLEEVTGDYHYFYVYSTKPTQVQCECEWQYDVAGEELMATDRYDYNLEKGWNLVKATIVNTHETKAGRFFTERRFETVPKEEKESRWYFIYDKKH